jgi:hypothetical protein
MTIGILIFGNVLSQNPFKSLGIPDEEVKVLTLSKGKYQEFHEDNLFERVGSAVINMSTGKIAYFINRDTLLTQTMLEPDITSRFVSIDPFAEKYPEWSPYGYAQSNPIRFIDFKGLFATDFYDQNGKYLGNDGVDDNRVVVVTDKQEAKAIKKTNKNGGTTAVSDVKSGVELPSAFVRSEMGKAVDRAGSPSFHEEGGFFGTTEGGDEYVVHAQAGETADPSVDPEASVSVFKAANPADIAKMDGGTIDGTFHTHPDGTVVQGNTNPNTIGGTTTTYSFNNPPSNKNGRGDIPNAQTNRMGVTGNSYVLAQGNKTVYIYNGSGTQATFPFKQFFSIGNKP